MSIKENLQEVHSHLPEQVQLVCVSKFHPDEAILEAYACGERTFGESHVQELCRKHEELPPDISWHFIGHLQTNKVKYIVPFVNLIHGVDSLKLLAEIDKQAAKIGRQVNCLLQMHIAQEESKFGMDETELREALARRGEWTHVTLCGLMGMATFTDDREQVRGEFRGLRRLFDAVKAEYFPDDVRFAVLSMGMSDDYRIAVEEGSTMVRIGTTIFGHRDYGIR